MVKRVSRNLVLAFALLILMVAVWVAWTIFVLPGQQAVGNIIAPLGAIETSPILNGFELNSPVSGEVFSGIVPLSVVQDPFQNKSIEVFLIGGGLAAPVFKGRFVSSTLDFNLNTSKYKDGACLYKLLFRLKSPEGIKEDTTKLFSIANSPTKIQWAKFRHPNTTNLDAPLPDSVRIEEPGAGKLVFDKQMLPPGTNLDTGIVFSHGLLTLHAEEFPCWPQNSVKVYFENITFNQPKLLQNGGRCRRCRFLKYENSSFVAELFLMGEYRVVEGLSSKLSVSNPTRDVRQYHAGEQVEFTAIYTSLDGTPLTGSTISCELKFKDRSLEMEYKDGAYLASRSFASAGTLEYSVECIDSSLETNSNRASDFVEIS